MYTTSSFGQRLPLCVIDTMNAYAPSQTCKIQLSRHWISSGVMNATDVRNPYRMHAIQSSVKRLSLSMMHTTDAGISLEMCTNRLSIMVNDHSGCLDRIMWSKLTIDRDEQHGYLEHIRRRTIQSSGWFLPPGVMGILRCWITYLKCMIQWSRHRLTTGLMGYTSVCNQSDETVIKSSSDLIISDVISNP